MAGSAADLSGMLSSMNASLGSIGGNVGRSMFDPMLQAQAEAREEARIAAEKEAAKTAAQAQAAAYADPMKRYELAKQQGDANGARKAAEDMRQAAITAGDLQGVQRASQMDGEYNNIANQGALKGVRDINNALADPALPEEARAALTARKETLMQNPSVQAAMQKEADAQTARDAQELQMQNTREAIEARKRQMDINAKTAERLVQADAGTAQGGSLPINATPEQIKKIKAGKSDVWKNAFDKSRSAAIDRHTKLASINMNAEMSEEEFKAFGETGMTYEEYKEKGKGMQSFAVINSQLKSRSDARYTQSLRPGATAKVAEKWHTEAAKELLDAGLRGYITNPDQADIDLVAAAYANGILVGELPSYIKNGKLTDRKSVV